MVTPTLAKRDYQICTRCIMDTSDPGIEFDAHGVCNRCRDYEVLFARLVPPPSLREETLRHIVEQIKAEGKHHDYDCVIGVSGGVDSTYTAYLVKKLGLRPLAVHLDNGWNSALAVSNIENCLKTLSIDLYTYVLDWDEFRDLQLAFLKASTPDSEIPTDHAIYSILVRKAAEIGARYIIPGVNAATEGISVPTWSAGHFDWKYIQSVQKMFGHVPLRSFPHLSVLDFAYFRYVKRQRQVYILNYVDYDKAGVMDLLQRELGWTPYPGKHHESIYTRFFQSYILPFKFGFDKRRLHLSTLIMSGQISREQALQEMGKQIYPLEQMREDKIFVTKKLGISDKEFDEILALPPKTFYDYPSSEKSLSLRAFRVCRQMVRRRHTSSS